MSEKSNSHLQDLNHRIGELHVQEYRLWHLCGEISRQTDRYGLDVDSIGSVERLLAQMRRADLPPWVTEGTLIKEQVITWLQSVVRLSTRFRSVTQAVCFYPERPRLRGTDEDVNAEALDGLISFGAVLAVTGDDLISSLSLETVTGARLAGFDMNVRRLYDAWLDPRLYELRPQGQIMPLP